MSGDFGLEDNTDGDGLSVEDSRGENSFVRMPNGVPKVDKVTKASFSLINCDDMGFDRNGSDND